MRFACLLLLAAGTAFAQQRPEPEVVTELGAYYSSIGLYVPISDDPYPDGGRLEEGDVYKQLLARSWQPNVFALEASVYPMPIVGVWVRKEYPDVYEFSPSLVQAVTVTPPLRRHAVAICHARGDDSPALRSFIALARQQIADAQIFEAEGTLATRRAPRAAPRAVQRRRTSKRGTPKAA